MKVMYRQNANKAFIHHGRFVHSAHQSKRFIHTSETSAHHRSAVSNDTPSFGATRDSPRSSGRAAMHVTTRAAKQKCRSDELARILPVGCRCRGDGRTRPNRYTVIQGGFR